MVDRKGASTLVAVFIVMVISLIAVSWFRANTTSGTGAQERVIQQSGLDTFNHRFENAKLYLENSLFFAGQRGSDLAANYSGRRSQEQEARYWYCAGSKQVPDPVEVRNATSNFTIEKMRDRFEEVHGIRDNTVYSVGKASCLDTGYNSLPAEEYSDNFTQALEITSVNLTRQDGGLKMSEEDVTLAKDIKYNRMWYIYSTLKTWVNQEDLRDEISAHLSNVRDSKKATNQMCISKASECNYPSPYMCSRHPLWFSGAVVEGLGDEMDRLESNENYFNGTGVECSIAMNRKNGQRYPGHVISLGVEKKAVNTTNSCACDEWNATDEPRHCVDYDYRFNCNTEWTLGVQSTVDFTVSCRDEKFSQVPNSSLKSLNWKIDLSYKASDMSGDGSFSCTNQVPPAGSPPVNPRECSYSGSPSTCSTPVETVG
jgi:hypothetical protein